MLSLPGMKPEKAGGDCEPLVEIRCEAFHLGNELALLSLSFLFLSVRNVVERVQMERIQSLLVCLQGPLSSCLYKITRNQFSFFILSRHCVVTQFNQL